MHAILQIIMLNLAWFMHDFRTIMHACSIMQRLALHMTGRVRIGSKNMYESCQNLQLFFFLRDRMNEQPFSIYGPNHMAWFKSPNATKVSRTSPL